MIRILAGSSQPLCGYTYNPTSGLQNPPYKDSFRSGENKAGFVYTFPPDIFTGKSRATLFFGSQPVIGEDVKIADHRFAVIGIREPKGEMYGENYDEMVFIPVSTGLRFFKGTTKIQSMIIYVRPDSAWMKSPGHCISS